MMVKHILFSMSKCVDINFRLFVYNENILQHVKHRTQFFSTLSNEIIVSGYIVIVSPFFFFFCSFVDWHQHQYFLPKHNRFPITIYQKNIHFFVVVVVVGARCCHWIRSTIETGCEWYVLCGHWKTQYPNSPWNKPPRKI